MATKVLGGRQIRRWLALVALGVGCIAMLVFGVAFARADALSEIPPDGYVDPSRPKHEQRRDFFKPYAAGAGAQRYQDLNPIERSGLDGIRTYYGSSLHGDAVHGAYAGGTRERLRYSRLRKAERAAGLEGVADLGVE